MSSGSELENAEAPRFGIAFGSNLGDRLATLSEAKRRLLERSDSPASALFSPVYESQPVDCPPGSQAFLNAVAEFSFPMPPEELLDFCQAIEAELGRPQERDTNAPRPLDLDLLYAGAETRVGATLSLPHPRLHLRRFVLQPLADIRPTLQLPGFSCEIGELLENLVSDEPPLRRIAQHW